MKSLVLFAAMFRRICKQRLLNHREVIGKAAEIMVETCNMKAPEGHAHPWGTVKQMTVPEAQAALAALEPHVKKDHADDMWVLREVS
jgi:hypothetical protein